MSILNFLIAHNQLDVTLAFVHIAVAGTAISVVAFLLGIAVEDFIPKKNKKP